MKPAEDLGRLDPDQGTNHEEGDMAQESIETPEQTPAEPAVAPAPEPLHRQHENVHVRLMVEYLDQAREAMAAGDIKEVGTLLRLASSLQWDAEQEMLHADELFVISMAHVFTASRRKEVK